MLNKPTETPAPAAQRLTYSPAIVGMFRKTAEPELNHAATVITEKRAAIAKLTSEIEAWERYVAEIRQVVAELVQNAAPAPAIPVGATAKCGPCGAQLTHGADRWMHSGRELLDNGDVCFPERPDSPVATPEGELSSNPDRALARINAAHDVQDASERRRS